MDNIDRNARALFDFVPERYDAFRPEYPDELVDDLVRATGFRKGKKGLEIGSGTGKLTRAIAQKGCEITGLELGSNLAAFANRTLEDFPRAEVLNADFDSFDPAGERFDIAMAATAFHWLNPATRKQRISGLLNDNGFLCLIDTHHIDGGFNDFPARSQECYAQWDEAYEPGFILPTPNTVALRLDSWENELADTFLTLASRTYRVDTEYTGDQYVSLLGTYSGVLGMGSSRRSGFLGCIRDMIEDHYGGSIVRSFLFELFVAQKR